MGGGGSRYKLNCGNQSSIPSWLLRTSELHELGHLSLESFDLQTVIGKGKFGIVYYALHKTSGKYVAIKFIAKKILYETKSKERTQQEVNILKMVSHPFTISYMGGFESLGALSLLFEYAPGGELYTRMKKDGVFSENVAKFYFIEISCAIGYLHSLNIVYRDLKPENILIYVNGHIKLCDFGFATIVGSNDGPLHDGCGTAMYVAPEIAGGHMKLAHGLPVDWWSLGCILYEMVAGEAPFGDTDKMSKFEIFNNINGAQVSFPLSISGNLKTLIRGLLEKNQQTRFNLSAVKSSPWLQEIDWDQVQNCQITPPWIPSDCKIPNKNHFVDWPGESYPTSCTPQENNYCSHFDFGVIRARRESTGQRGSRVLTDVEKSPTSVNRKMRSHESKNSIVLESWKSDTGSSSSSSNPPPRLSESKARSSSRLLDVNSSSSGNSRSRSSSRLEPSHSSSNLGRQRTNPSNSYDNAAKSALLNAADDIDDLTTPKQKQHHNHHNHHHHHVHVY